MKICTSVRRQLGVVFAVTRCKWNVFHLASAFCYVLTCVRVNPSQSNYVSPFIESVGFTYKDFTHFESIYKAVTPLVVSYKTCCVVAWSRRSRRNGGTTICHSCVFVVSLLSHPWGDFSVGAAVWVRPREELHCRGGVCSFVVSFGCFFHPFFFPDFVLRPVSIVIVISYSFILFYIYSLPFFCVPFLILSTHISLLTLISIRILPVYLYSRLSQTRFQYPLISIFTSLFPYSINTSLFPILHFLISPPISIPL